MNKDKSSGFSRFEIDGLVDKILMMRSEENEFMIKKFSKENLIATIEGDKFREIEGKFNEYEKKGVDIVDFVRIFLSVIEHEEDETIFITTSLVELFKDVSESINANPYVRYTDFTNYVAEV